MALFKKKDFFFESFVELLSYPKNCLNILCDGIEKFDNKKLIELKDNVHKVEHEADMKKREVEEKLAKEFMTPIDREDIFLLLDLIDDLTDAIDDVSYKLYIRNYQSIPPDLTPFMEQAKIGVDGVIEVFKKFDDIKNKTVMDPLIQVVLDVEENGDKLYEQKVHELYVKNKNYEQIRLYERIYQNFENITDKCRDIVKEVLIIMYKNL